MAGSQVVVVFMVVVCDEVGSILVCQASIAVAESNLSFFEIHANNCHTNT